jgi:hypothetical protein
MGSKSSAPEPPDPKETSAASTSTNVGTAIANAMMSNVSERTPDGRTRVKQTGTYEWKDPYTGKTYDIPMFSRRTFLSPAQRAIKKQQDAASLNLSTLANNQSSFLNDYMAEPFSYNPGEHEGWALGLYDQLNAPKEAQADESLRTRLANQGIKEGSEAYDREMQNFRSGATDSRNKFLLDSYNTGMQTALTERNQPINEITSLMSGSQVSQPSFMGANMPTIPTTDVAGLINTNYDQRFNRYQYQQRQQQQMLGGLFGLGSSLIAASDERVKEDIEPLGEIEGQNVYSYKYKGDFNDGETHIGVMAQEVEQKRPDAVMTGKDGVKRVHYGKLFGLGERMAA